MDETRLFPERYMKNIHKLMNVLSTDCETAFSMMLMTAALMDLRPEDPKVVEMILDDCCADIGSIA